MHAVISQAGRGKKICKFVYPQPIIPKGKKKKKGRDKFRGQKRALIIRICGFSRSLIS